MADKIAVPESALYYTKGTTTYVDVNGNIVANAVSEPVMVRDSSDLSKFSHLDPGAMAYTAGFKKMWQKAADGSWIAIIGEA